MTFAFIQNVPSQTAKLFPTTLQVSLEPSTGGFRHAPSLYRTAMFFPYAPLTHDCPALVWPSAQLLARPSFAAFCAAEAGGELRHKFCAVQLCTVRSCELCLIPSTTYHLRTEIEGGGGGYHIPTAKVLLEVYRPHPSLHPRTSKGAAPRSAARASRPPIRYHRSSVNPALIFTLFVGASRKDA